MDGTASVAGVGAVVNQIQTQVRGQQSPRPNGPRVVSADLGSNALKLIQALVVDVSAPGRDLDVTG